ncbi:hypothetical protein SBDP1_100095 [Syntrophobacter sp. SbD1]|nr:hypothetical protein SBDP1_100095 [Syntrophobacter sp. SbD1]
MNKSQKTKSGIYRINNKERSYNV